MRLVSIMADVSDRRRAQAAVRESEARFRSIFENVAVGIAYTDLAGHWIEVNERLCNILGYPRTNLMATALDQLTAPDDRGRDLDEMGRVLSGEVEHSAFEARYRRADGSEIWVGRTISLVRDGTGCPQHFISVFRDISERKTAQEHQRFLLSELAHRSKNLLAVIQALASQTIRSVDTLSGFRDRFMHRLQGLAKTQDILVTLEVIFWSVRCRVFEAPIGRSSGDRWSSWSDRGERLKIYRESSSRPRSPSQIGFVRPSAKPASAAMVRPAPSAKN